MRKITMRSRPAMNRKGSLISANSVVTTGGIQTWSALVLLCAIPAFSLAQPPESSRAEPGHLEQAQMYNWGKPQQIEDGYLASVSSASNNTVLVTSLTSGSASPVSIQVTVNGRAPLRITGAAVVPGNQLAAVGSLSANDGVDGFLARFDFSGNQLSTINLQTFVPHQVCATSDGTVWVLGQDVAAEGAIWYQHGSTTTANTNDYNMLRAYDDNGTLMRSFLPRSTASTAKQGLFVNLHANTTAATMACGNESVGVYLALADNPTWYEVAATDTDGRSWRVTGAPTPSVVTGLALPFTNTVYASFRVKGVQGRRTAGLYTLVFGTNGLAQWTPAMIVTGGAAGPATSRDVPELKILGINGTDVLYVQRSTPSLSGLAGVRTINATPAPSPTSALPAPTSSVTVQAYTDNMDDAFAESFTQKVSQFQAQQASVCTTTDCQTALSGLNSEVTKWKSAKTQGTTTNKGNAEIAKNIAQSLRAYNVALRSAAQTLAGGDQKASWNEGSDYHAAPGLIETICGPDCLTRNLGDARVQPLFLARGWNGEFSLAPDYGKFIRVFDSTSYQDCMDQCDMYYEDFGEFCEQMGALEKSGLEEFALIFESACKTAALLYHYNCYTACCDIYYCVDGQVPK